MSAARWSPCGGRPTVGAERSERWQRRRIVAIPPEEQRCVATVDRIEKVGPVVAFLFLLHLSTGYGWEVKVETW